MSDKIVRLIQKEQPPVELSEDQLEIVEDLEYFLREVRAGRITGYAAVATTNTDGEYVTGFRSKAPVRLIGMLEVLKKEMINQVD